RGYPCRSRDRAPEKSVCRCTCGRRVLSSHTRRCSLCRDRADRKPARMWSQRVDSCEHLVHRSAYFGELLLRQAETRRQIETLAGNPFRHWIMLIMKQPLGMKNRLFVHAEKERAGFYAALFEPQGKTNRIYPGIFGKHHAVHPIHTFGP